MAARETLAFYSPWDDIEAWRKGFAASLPEVEIRQWPDVGDPARVAYAFVEGTPDGALAALPNLKIIFSPGAGIDHLMRDPELPKGIPITRNVQDRMTLGMTQYVVLHALRHHRHMPEYQAQQKAGVWQEIKQAGAWDTRAGVLGLGAIGLGCAEALAAIGFETAGWTRTPRTHARIECFHGPDGLMRFLARTDILVCVLPLTPETEGIVNARTLAALPEGASFINLGRGRHVVEEDLLAALDSGRLSHATLDVFRTEPLPKDSRFWSHPRVTVTPHRAGNSNRLLLIDQAIENVRRLRAGQPLINVADSARGY